MKKIVSIMLLILLLVVSVTACGDGVTKQDWFNKQYDGTLKDFQAEYLSVSIPESFVVEDGVITGKSLLVQDSVYDSFTDDEGIFWLSLEYQGLVQDDGLEPYIKQFDERHSKDWGFLDSAYDINGKGYSGKETCEPFEYAGAMNVIDLVIVDSSVFEVNLMIKEEYYHDNIMEVVRDHIDWEGYKSNKISELKVEYLGDGYSGDIVDESDLLVTAVNEDGTKKEIDAENCKLEFPKGDTFESNKSLQIVVIYREAGEEYKASIECECIGEFEDDSSSSNGNYHSGDKNGEKWDTDDDGSVSGDEFRDAVNDYMDENGY